MSDSFAMIEDIVVFPVPGAPVITRILPCSIRIKPPYFPITLSIIFHRRLLNRANKYFTCFKMIIT